MLSLSYRFKNLLHPRPPKHHARKILPRYFSTRINDSDLQNRFNHRLREIFSERNKYLDYYPQAAQAIYPSHAEDILEKFNLTLLKKDSDTLDRYYTNCGATVMVLQAVAKEILIPNPQVSEKEIYSDSLCELTHEMMENRLKFYKFLLGKGDFCHHFVLIKFPTENLEPIFSLYQSYICKYSLGDYMNSSHFKSHNFKSLNEFLLKPVVEMVDKEEWAESDYEHYQNITHVSMRDFERKIRNYSGMGKARYQIIAPQYNSDRMLK